MAFERIEIAVGKVKSSAGICISKHGKTIVAIRSDLVAASGFKADGKFTVLLGREDDSGKLRIIKDKDGVACARELKRTGAFFFNLGMVPAIGTVQVKQQPTEARPIKDGFEIDIPTMGPKLLPAPTKAAAPDADDAAEADNDGQPKGERIGDVWICDTEDEESITFNGKSIAVAAREAEFLVVLARTRPNVVAPSYIIGKLWAAGKAPGTAGLQIGQLATDLKKSLPSIGLTVNLVKGAGYQLRNV